MVPNKEPSKFPDPRVGMTKVGDLTWDCGYAYSDIGEEQKKRWAFWLTGRGYVLFYVKRETWERVWAHDANEIIALCQPEKVEQASGPSPVQKLDTIIRVKEDVFN